MNKTIPNFLIGGPPKCASTSLYFYLKQHPEIFMSAVKQTRFFSVYYDKGAEYYTNTHFSGITNEKMAGEATPTYFLLPFVPARIKAYNPDMKIIFCLHKADICFRMLMQPGQVDLKIIGALMTKFQDMNCNGTFSFCQHSCNSQTITTIVSFTAKNLKCFVCIVIPFQPVGTFTGGSFHQVNRSDGFMFDRILIP